MLINTKFMVNLLQQRYTSQPAISSLILIPFPPPVSSVGTLGPYHSSKAARSPPEPSTARTAQENHGSQGDVNHAPVPTNPLTECIHTFSRPFPPGSKVSLETCPPQTHPSPLTPNHTPDLVTLLIITIQWLPTNHTLRPQLRSIRWVFSGLAPAHLILHFSWPPYFCSSHGGGPVLLTMLTKTKLFLVFVSLLK